MTCRRGTTNGNDRGNSRDRQRRREWLVGAYRANVDAGPLGVNGSFTPVPLGEGVPACRCYRCGELLTADTTSIDRRVPGCEGGTYAKENIRPACLPCNSSTGGRLGASRKGAAA